MSKHVPAGWKDVIIDDCCKIIRGASPRPIGDPSYFGGNVGWVRISDVTASSKYLRKTQDYLSPLGVSKSIKVTKGDLIMSICGTVGRPIIVDMEACIHDGFVQFTKINNFDVEYCYYLLQTLINEFISKAQPGTQINLNTTIVGNTSISLPPLPEQRKIAAVLSSADRSIAATEKLIAKLADLKKALMQQLLTKGIGHTEFKPSPLGPIPKSWEVEKAEVLLERKVLLALKDGNHGSFYPRANEFASNGLPFISASDIDEDGNINFSECKRLPLDKAKRLTIPPAIGGDVMLTHNATVGRVALLPNEIGPVIASTSTTYYRTNSDVLASNYLKYFFSSPLYQQQLKEIMGQTTRNQVPITAQKDLFIIIPNIGEQIRLSAIFDALTNKQTAAKVKLAKAKDLKQGLMNDLLTGKVRVKA